MPDRPDRTPEEAADVALRAADEAAEGVMDRLRAEGRQQALSVVLAGHQYRVGVEIARRIGYSESGVFEIVNVAASITGDDPYLAFEDAFGLDRRLLD